MGKDNNGKKPNELKKVGMKAIWTVSAGVVPYHPKPEYTKIWVYTVTDFENDQNMLPEEVTRFAEIVDEVSNYQWTLTDPDVLNWVHSDFHWME